MMAPERALWKKKRPDSGVMPCPVFFALKRLEFTR